MTFAHPAETSNTPVTKADLLRWRLATEEALARPDGHPSREPDEEHLMELLRRNAAQEKELRSMTRKRS